MEIFLIRHGLAGKADPARYPDDDLRPLTSKGRKAFKRAAKGLRALGVNPKLILAGPALRTRETAGLLAHGLGLGAESIRNIEALHHGVPPARALAKLSRMRLPRSVALVGHEPWLGEFLSLLIAGNGKARLEMDKGGGCLVAAEVMKPGKGTLSWLMTQDQLAALA